MANRGYDVVVDVDEEGDLGHTDLQEDNLEFHSSNFTEPTKPSNGTLPSNNSSSHKRIPSLSSSSLQSKKYLWSLSFYAQYFDVDTNEVLRRSVAPLMPLPSTPSFLDVLDGRPDLYGPFWIATTVVVILFLTGTMSWSLKNKGMDNPGYDFTLLSGAAGLVYGYTFLVPVGLWGALKWSGSEAVVLLECVALYGYANGVWIPVSLISWSKLDLLNYIFVGIGFGISALFLTRNLYPIISTTPHQRAKALLILVIILHFGLAVAIKFLFFAHNSPANKPSNAGSSPPSSGKDGDAKDQGGDGDGKGDGADDAKGDGAAGGENDAATRMALEMVRRGWEGLARL